MAEVKGRKSMGSDKLSVRQAGKICEHMNYSGREAFKRLRTNAMIALGADSEKKCRVIGITSAQPSEGKSTVTINLAYSFAELGKSVLLIDCDMRRPSIHKTIGAQLSPGLSEVLVGTNNLKDTMVRYKSSKDGTFFDLIPAGENPDNPSELLNSSRFQKFIEVVSGAYEYVLVDLPPVNAVVDAVSASKSTDGLIVVIRENYCPRSVLSGCMEQLQYAKANILGFVMNGCVAGAGKRYSYQNRYGQPYEYRNSK